MDVLIKGTTHMDSRELLTWTAACHNIAAACQPVTTSRYEYEIKINASNHGRLLIIY